MERELWRWMAWGLKRLPRWCPRGAVYDNRRVLAVLLRAALSERSISWACRRGSWPPQAWRRVRPDQSTMSRRLRDPRVVEDLLRQARERGTLPEGATTLGDAAYDSNLLHAAAASVRTKPIAPRRRPDLELCANRTHHPGRIESIAATEGSAEHAAELRRKRATIERYFGTLAGAGGGLAALPAWVRRRHRVTARVGAKLIIHAARHVRRRMLAA